MIRKVGVRSPFMPGPLEAGAPVNTDPRRPVLIIQGFGPPPPDAQTLWLVRPREPNVDPRRPIRVVDAPDPPLSGGLTIWLRAPRDEAAAPANTDPRRPVVVLRTPFTPPAGAVTFIRPPRAPNADPRRPIAVLRTPFTPPASRVVWLRAGRVAASGYAAPFTRHTFRARADAAASIPALGRIFTVAADAASEQV